MLKLKIDIEGDEKSDVMLELNDVLVLLREGTTSGAVDSGLSSHVFELKLATPASVGKHVEKKSPVRAKRKGKEMVKRKVVLIQSDEPLSRPKDFKAYIVAELRGTVEFSISDRLSKAEVESLIRRPGFEVVIRGTRA